jgi:hypothetical protein
VSTLFDKLATWLPAMEAHLAAVEGGVTYRRGAEVLEGVPAVVGRTVFSSNLNGGARVEWGDRDYLIAAADLADLGGEPAEGDTIEQTVDGTAVVFKVLPPDTGEPAYRWSDGETRQTWRLHCKGWVA